MEFTSQYISWRMPLGTSVEERRKKQDEEDGTISVSTEISIKAGRMSNRYWR